VHSGRALPHVINTSPCSGNKRPNEEHWGKRRMMSQSAVLPKLATSGHRREFFRRTFRFLSMIADLFEEVREMRRQARVRFPYLIEL
jgi:hypothetical protein